MSKNLVALADVEDHECEWSGNKPCSICTQLYLAGSQARWKSFLQKMQMVKSNMENPAPDLRVQAAIAGNIPREDKI